MPLQVPAAYEQKRLAGSSRGASKIGSGSLDEENGTKKKTEQQRKGPGFFLTLGKFKKLERCLEKWDRLEFRQQKSIKLRPAKRWNLTQGGWILVVWIKKNGQVISGKRSVIYIHLSAPRGIELRQPGQFEPLSLILMRTVKENINRTVKNWPLLTYIVASFLSWRANCHN